MNPGDMPEGFPKGVRLVPVYQYVPCEDSTGPLTQYVTEQLRSSSAGLAEIELFILRWLVDNGMAIVKRN